TVARSGELPSKPRISASGVAARAKIPDHRHPPEQKPDRRRHPGPAHFEDQGRRPDRGHAVQAVRPSQGAVERRAMREEIASLVHPVFAYGLRLKERLKKGERLDLHAEQAALKGLLLTDM